MDSKEHLEDTLNSKIRPIFEMARLKIEQIKPGETYPATTLADDLAKEFDTTGPALYPILKFLFTGYPGIVVRRGAHGGLHRLEEKKNISTQTNNNVTDSTDTNEIVSSTTIN